jgi:cyclohexanone monooxygenase
MASGCLSNPKPPEIEGIETFAGTSFHSSRWPDEGVDLAGRRVGVIGTASTGIQMIPVIAEQVGSLHVFQRTANFCLPARVKPLSDETMASVKSVYPELREKIRRSPAGYLIDTPTRGALEVPAAEREAIYRHAWEENPGAFLGSFNDLRTNIDSNETAAAFVRERITEIVDDAETAEDLTPRDHPIGAKRICVGTNYYETYNRENVHLVNLRKTPIDRVVPEGVVVDGRLIELDTLIYATGFDAMTGALLAVDIRGRDGISFREKWVAGPRTYLGLAVADFPNLFTITGPGSPSVISNMVFSIEHHVDWIADCIAHMRRNRLTVVEADETAQDDWVEHVNEVANRTLFPRAASWYVGANVPGKPRVFMPYVGGTLSYRATCQEVVDDGYRGFRFAPGSDDDLAALDERMDRADR